MRPAARPGSPARAGIGPSQPTQKRLSKGFPRASGDRPGNWEGKIKLWQIPPRERESTHWRGCWIRTERGSPASGDRPGPVRPDAGPQSDGKPGWQVASKQAFKPLRKAGCAGLPGHQMQVEIHVATGLARPFAAYSVSFDDQRLSVGQSAQPTPGVTLTRRCRNDRSRFRS